MKHSASRIFRLPVVIGLASLAALIIALMGEGWHDMVSWVGLALPVAAVGYGILRRG